MNDDCRDGFHDWVQGTDGQHVCLVCETMGRDCPECCGQGCYADENECERCGGEEVVAD